VTPAEADDLDMLGPCRLLSGFFNSLSKAAGGAVRCEDAKEIGQVETGAA